MIYFFDTSALLKYYHEEKGSAEIIRIIDSDSSSLWVSELAFVELNSAFMRRYREKELASQDVDRLVKLVAETHYLFTIEPLSSLLVKEAGTLLRSAGKTYSLRTLDALQLATFEIVCEPDWIFITADKTLYEVSKKRGHKAAIAGA
jgi:predicted nucleic acid-binding protein